MMARKQIGFQFRQFVFLALFCFVLNFSTSRAAEDAQPLPETKSIPHPGEKSKAVPSGATRQDVTDFIQLQKLYISPDDPAQPIPLDGRKYRRDWLIWDFLNIALSTHLLIEDQVAPSWFLGKLLWERKILIERSESPAFAWVRKNIIDDLHLPKSGVINKWDRKELGVGIGMPPVENADFERENELATDPAINESVKKILKSLAGKTRFSFHFVEPQSPEDVGENFARIRIIPIKDNGYFNNYKSHNYISGNPHHRSKLGLGALLAGAVPFTTGILAQVEGFFIPDQNNNIVFAACFVSTEVSEEVQQTLIRECILRSLGLPELSQSDQGSVLGNWNKAQDATSSRREKDYLSWSGRAELDAMPASKKDETIPTALRETLNRNALTDLDLFMLNLLYCEDVKAGMDKLNAASILVNSKKCGLRL